MNNINRIKRKIIPNIVEIEFDLGLDIDCFSRNIHKVTLDKSINMSMSVPNRINSHSVHKPRVLNYKRRGRHKRR